MSACDSIKQGLTEALAFAEGREVGAVVHTVEVPDVDVAAIRASTGLSQAAFARSIGVAKGTLLGWAIGAFGKAAAQFPPNFRRSEVSTPRDQLPMMKVASALGLTKRMPSSIGLAERNWGRRIAPMFWPLALSRGVKSSFSIRQRRCASARLAQTVMP